MFCDIRFIAKKREWVVSVIVPMVFRYGIYGFLLTLLFVPYQTKLSGYAIPSLFLALCLCAVLVGFVLNRPSVTDFFYSSEGKLWTGFLFFFVLSAVVINHSKAVYLQAYFVSLVTYLVFRLSGTIINPDKLLKWIPSYLILNGLFSYAQIWGGPAWYPAAYIVNGGLSDFRMPYGLQDIPTTAGLFSAVLLVGVMAKFSLENNKKVGVVALLAMFMGGGSVLLAASRASLLAVAVGVLIVTAFVILKKGRPVNLILMVGAITGGLVISYVACIDSNAYRPIRYKIVEPLLKMRLSDGSFQQRLLTLKMVADEFGPASPVSQASPASPVSQASHTRSVLMLLFGIGIGNAESHYGEYLSSGKPEWADKIGQQTISVHNSFVEFLFEAGAIVFGFFSFITAYVLYRAIRSRREELIPYIIMFVSLCAWMLFQDYLRNRPFWLLLGILAAFAAKQRPKSILAR